MNKIKLEDIPLWLLDGRIDEAGDIHLPLLQTLDQLYSQQVWKDQRQIVNLIFAENDLLILDIEKRHFPRLL